MKILITGGTGLLGSACIRHFTKIGHEVVCAPPRGFDLRKEDLANSLIQQVKPDAIIHCAARVGGVMANKIRPVDFLSDNLRIQTNVIDAAGRNDVPKLVFIGTSCMFPNDAACPVIEESLLTGRLNDSVEAYAIAKIAGWRLCKAWWEQYGKSYITLAPCNIYGPNDNYGPDAHVIPALIKKAHASMKYNIPMEIWGDGSAVREFIHADDVASAIDIAIQKWDSPEVLNVGSGERVTIRELVGEITKKTSPLIDVRWDLTKPIGVPRKTFDVTKLKTLGWSPKLSLSDGLDSTISEFLENERLKAADSLDKV